MFFVWYNRNMRLLALPVWAAGQGGRFFRGIRDLPRHPRAAAAAIAAVLVVLTVVSSTLLLFRQPAGAATYTFVQNNWTGGLDGGTRPVHPTNQTGWTKYDSKTSLVDTTQANLALLGLTTNQFVQTTETDFNAGTKTNTAVTGTGSAASVQLAAGDDVYSIYTQQTDGDIMGTMALGSSGNPVISYVGDGATTLNLTVCNNATCSSRTQRQLAVWSGNAHAYASAVTVNGSGNPVVAYGRYQLAATTNWWVYMISCNDATCSSWGSAVQAATGTGSFSGIVTAMTNSLGQPVFAYAESGLANTSVVRCTTVTCSSFGGPTIVSTGAKPAITKGSDGNPVLVTEEHVVDCTNAECSTKNSVALSSSRAAIAVGSDNIPTVAYYAGTDLKVQRCTTTACTALTAAVTVDSANDVGEAPSIVMASGTSFPVISYMDNTTGQMKVAYCATATCSSVDHITTIGAMSFNTTFGDRGTSIILGSDNKPMAAYRSTANINVADSTAGFEPSGTFASSILDTVGPAGGGWGTMTWNNNANPTLSLKARTSNSATMTGAPAFSTCTAITKGADISSNSCVNDTHRYIQYEATFSTSNPTITPQFNDITIQFLPYTTTPQDLISSWYDTNDPANIFQDIIWVETLPAATNVTFQLRTAPDAAGAPGTPSVWCGSDNAAAGCSGSFTDPSGATETVDAELRTGSNDQWIQYKVTMQSTNGNSSPTLTSVTLTYVVNAPPAFNPNYPSTGLGGATASQQTDGSVTVSFSARDPDTTQGTTNPGSVSPTYQYSLNNGGSWTAIPFANMSADADDLKAVGEVSYTAYTVTWYPKQHISGTYANQTKVRVVLNDNELANNTAQADSAAFVLDVKNPASVALTLNAADESLVLAATDDTALTMNISLIAATFPPASEQPFASPVSMTLTENQTVYVRVTDARSNNTTIQATTPTTPKNVIIRDTSNASTSAWQEFISWEIVAAPAAGFGSYEVHRSIDGGAYALRTTITDRLTNFYVDQGLTTGSNYAYKILTKDTPGNKSDYSAIVQDIPDGQGGTDVTPPTISSVTTASVDTTSATITWNTNELADSTVGFSLVCLTDPLEQGSPSFVLSHTLTITGLQPGTTYFYYVKSEDAVGNLGSDNNGGICYAFVTNQGPTISSVGVSDIGGSTAKVSWQTNFPADSEVLYSTSSTLTSPQTQTVATLLTAHNVTLMGLTPATRYYLDVRSTDALGNRAWDTNAGNHYFFDTTTDTTPPALTNVRAEAVELTSAVIRWDTDESSTSQVEYGTTSNYGSMTTTQTELVFGHSVVLEGLNSGNEYHFRARSADATGNAATSADFSFTTIQEKKAGGSPPDPKDLTPPKISELAVTVLSSSEARATWRTDEPANTILRYGTSTQYGFEGAGAFDQYSKDHTVELTALKADTEYHAQVVAFDQAGNSAMSDDVTFRTPPEGEEPAPEVAEEEAVPEEPEPQPEPAAEPEEPAEESTEAQETIEEISSVSGFSVDQLLEVLREQFPGRTFTPEEFQEVIEKIGEPPLIAGDFPRVQVGATEATITWITDRPANSLVAYTREDRWRQDQPYPLEVGSSTELVKIHVVRLTGLSPATSYVFEVRSRGPIGGLARKGPFRFTTLSPTLAITDVDFVAPASDTLRFRWATSFPAFTTLTVTNVNTGKAVTLRGDRLLVEHEFTLADVDPASEYRANIVATDALGNAATFPEFLVSTSKDTRPPIITQVRTQTALVESSFGDRVQTIITWITNEQSTSQVYYQEGAGNIASKDPAAYAFATDRKSDYATDHTVVIASFRPNSVYQYIVVSEDRAGNRTISDPFAILTPQRRESVLQLILRNFEQLFRFLPGV